MANPMDIIRGSAREAWGLLSESVTEVRSGLQLFETWRTNIAQWPSSNYRVLAQEGYGKNALVYACIREITGSVSEAPYSVGVEADKVMVPVLDHPAYELLQNPNDDMTGFDFWEGVLTLEHISGNSPVWKERNTSTGRPVALWPLRPDWVRYVPKRNIRSSYYIYSPDGNYDPEKLIPIPRTDMIHFKYGLDPINLYGSALSPMSVIFRNIVLDNDETDFMKVFFDNAGVPSGIIKVKGRIGSQRIANRIRRRWQQNYTGKGGWNAPAVLDDDAEYQRVGMDFREMVMDAIRDVPESRICMGFGVPPILVGANVGLKRSTYTNYPSARVSFWDETLSPIYRRHALRVDKDLIDLDFPTATPVKSFFDLAGVRALREDRNAVWRRATQALTAGGITVNMFLQEIGKEAIPGMDVFLSPDNHTLTPAGASQESFKRMVTSLQYRELFTTQEVKLLTAEVVE